MKMNKWIIVTAFLIPFSSCKDYTPKPKAYPRIIYPERAYKQIEADCPFSFEIPVLEFQGAEALQSTKVST